MVEIIPSILVKTEEELISAVGKIRGLVEWVQYDVGDGIFVPSETFSDARTVGFHLSSFKAEVHLMVSDPLNRISEWRDAGVRRFLIHIESVPNIESSIIEAKSYSVEVGVSVKLETDLKLLEPILSYIDVVQLMGVEPGKQGQFFDEKVVDRITKVREMHSIIPIEIDGGVNEKTAPALVEAGATRLAPGSYIFKNDDVASAIQRLRIS